MPVPPELRPLIKFSAGSMNDGEYTNLWIKGASLFIDQLLALLKQTDYKPPLIDVHAFDSEYSRELGDVLNRNRSDKANSHIYHLLYSHILNKSLKRHDKLNILEIGLGTNNPSLVSSMGNGGRPGASLYSWEEYLPNANVYGADIDKDILFNAGRIKTTYVDQMESKTFNDLQTAFGNPKYDMIIDDGLHSIGANLNTLLFGLEHVKTGGWVVIEDIHIEDTWSVVDFILSANKKYKTHLIKTSERGSWMYAVNKLSE